MNNSGLYVLLMALEDELALRIGALGEGRLSPGLYLYTGSARTNLRQRVERHFSKSKRVRWHIDHLTTVPAVHPLGAVLAIGGELRECDLNRDVGSLPDMTAPIPRFRASDCRAGCAAHLWHFPGEMSLAGLGELLSGKSGRWGGQHALLPARSAGAVAN